ncbi:MAG: hemolysin III family protein [Candidatus Saccharibacteria bacterium]|nr:hemolysin III family protein [Candidatus Saccharibacteria bacterium]
MKKRTKLADRELPDYTRGEEIFNMVSHIVAAAFSVPILILCIIRGAIEYGAAGVLTGLAFTVSMLVLFTISAIYHGLNPKKRAKKVMQIIDHCSIFLLIAGSYTPITLIALMKTDPAAAWVMFSVVWVMSIVGIVLNAIDLKRFAGFSMACYLGLGWCIILCLPNLMAVLPPIGTVLLFLGGIMYTIGAMFFGLEKEFKYMHSVFHLLVLCGSVCHGLMILLCIL